MARRIALLIGNQVFEENKTFPDLCTPENDVRDLAEVLQKNGDFEIFEQLIDKDYVYIKEAVEDLYTQADKGDLTLLYYSGHGYKDAANRYFLIAKNTSLQRLVTTGIHESFLHEVLSTCRSRHNIIILECCFSGAFIKGKRSGSEPVNLQELKGEASAILASSSSTKYSFEIAEKWPNALFTHFLLEGILTGKADADTDGKISVEELFEYIEPRVRAERPEQTPMKDVISRESILIIANNPIITTGLARLPKGYEDAMINPLHTIRKQIILDLFVMLESKEELEKPIADALYRLSTDEHPDVKAEALKYINLITSQNQNIFNHALFPDLDFTAPTSHAQVSHQDEQAVYYYPWQNPILRKTIYPHREKKLRDFLLSRFETDILHQDIDIKQEDLLFREVMKETIQGFARITGVDEKTLLERRKQDLSQQLRDLEREQDQLENTIKSSLSMTEDKVKELSEQIKGISVSINKLYEEKDFLEKLTNRDPWRDALINYKLLNYQQILDGMDHDQLVNEVMDRFNLEPERFAKWLQYMVIHFSGMRYRSAHGSYRDPKDLLRVLGVDTKGLSDKKALQILKDYKEEQEQDGKPIPAWAWHEIVKYTPLRNETREDDWEVKEDDDWEVKKATDLSTDEGKRWDQILKNWEPENTQLFNNLTLWRSKHQETFDLIVTSAVANEIAEHIQHLRGHSTAPGLSMKPDWYNKQKIPGGYFKHLDSVADLKSGAAIFWLEWYDSTPGAHEVVTAITGIVDLTEKLCAGKVKTGPLIFREEWTCWKNNNRFFRTINVKPTLDDKKLIKTLKLEVEANLKHLKKVTDQLTIANQLSTEERTRLEREIKSLNSKIDRNDQKIAQINQKSGKKIQYLRWVHEAIVVGVEEMLDGKYVMTFETAGNTGINRRPLGELINNPYVFVGYVPQVEKLPEIKENKLKQMTSRERIINNKITISS